MQSLKILLVEDSDILREIQAKMIHSIGHKIATVANGEQALERLHNTQFDLILMDLVLPGLSGIETTHKIKQLHIDTPIIALSGNQTVATQEACFDAGMAAFLKKPTDAKTFTTVLQKVFG